MITYFPTFYPDELVYSLISRFYVESGYHSYQYVHSLIYQNRSIRPSKLYLSPYTDKFYQLINLTKETLIKEHTMFPFYYRFAKQETKEYIYKKMMKDVKVRGISRTKVLRFCPICSQIDRNKYGVTYWHRLHQMPLIKICPIHGCYLLDTNILITERHSLLKAAEDEIPIKNKIEFCENKIEQQFASYVMNVFFDNNDWNCTIRDILISKLNEIYLSKGIYKKINHKAIYNYLQNNFYELLSTYQLNEDIIKNILDTTLFDLDIVCFVAFCFHISNDEIKHIKRKSFKQKSWDELDEELLHIVKKNIKEKMKKRQYSQITLSIIEKELGLSQRQLDYLPKCKSEILKEKDYKKIDTDLLPFVQEIIKKKKENNEHFSITSIEKELGLLDKYIKRHLLKCKKEIENAKKI